MSDMSINNPFEDSEQPEVDSRGRIQKKAWYTLVVFPGREKKIRDKLVKLAVNSPKLREQIFEVVIPAITEVNDKGKAKETMIYTQYVYIEMILNDDTYHAVKIEGVRHILGEPTPLTENEVRNLFKSIGREYTVEVDYAVGESVQIIDKENAFYHQNCVISEVNVHKKEATVLIDMFGRETRTKVNFVDIKKL
jgi:transcriptional antiterminator NusG